MTNQSKVYNGKVEHQCCLEGEFSKYEFAKLSFDECKKYLQLYKQISNLSADSKSVFEEVVSKSFVITYSRPFTGGRSAVVGSGAISDNWLKKLTEDQQKLHADVLRGRNLLVAHFDAECLNPIILIKDGPHNALIFDWDLVMISENNISALHGLVTSAYDFCNEFQGKIKTRLVRDNKFPLVVHQRKK